MTPRQATTEDQICALPRDNAGTGEHWITLGERTVTIAAQVAGEAATETICLPRRTFEAFIDWYNTGKWRKPRQKVTRAKIE